MTQGLRIAMLCHSTNPRGGVAHALALAEALHDAGHAVTVIAPDANGEGFPRVARCRTFPFPAAPVRGDLRALVDCRAIEYRDVLADISENFDLLHAHDALSGSCVADAVADGLALPYVRTVHHLEFFSDAALAGRQARSVAAADEVVCVSRVVADDVRHAFDRTARVIPNGVDTSRFTPVAGPRDARWTHRLGGGGPNFLAIGGIEARKNSARLLRAFALVHARRPMARLTIVGGASLLDHAEERRAFQAVLTAGGDGLAAAVDLVGVVADADLPALCRVADALVFPSVREGFGLVVLEAMACGTPVVVSRLAPFVEYLSEADAAWCDPLDAGSIAAAMLRAVAPAAVGDYRRRGLAAAARHTWAAAAASHRAAYATLAARNAKEWTCPR